MDTSDDQQIAEVLNKSFLTAGDRIEISVANSLVQGTVVGYCRDVKAPVVWLDGPGSYQEKDPRGIFSSYKDISQNGRFMSFYTCRVIDKSHDKDIVDNLKMMDFSIGDKVWHKHPSLGVGNIVGCENGKPIVRMEIARNEKNYPDKPDSVIHSKYLMEPQNGRLYAANLSYLSKTEPMKTEDDLINEQVAKHGFSIGDRLSHSMLLLPDGIVVGASDRDIYVMSDVKVAIPTTVTKAGIVSKHQEALTEGRVYASTPKNLTKIEAPPPDVKKIEGALAKDGLKIGDQFIHVSVGKCVIVGHEGIYPLAMSIDRTCFDVQDSQFVHPSYRYARKGSIFSFLPTDLVNPKATKPVSAPESMTYNLGLKNGDRVSVVSNGRKEYLVDGCDKNGHAMLRDWNTLAEVGALYPYLETSVAAINGKPTKFGGILNEMLVKKGFTTHDYNTPPVVNKEAEAIKPLVEKFGVKIGDMIDVYVRNSYEKFVKTYEVVGIHSDGMPLIRHEGVNYLLSTEHKIRSINGKLTPGDHPCMPKVMKNSLPEIPNLKIRYGSKLTIRYDGDASYCYDVIGGTHDQVVIRLREDSIPVFLESYDIQHITHIDGVITPYGVTRECKDNFDKLGILVGDKVQVCFTAGLKLGRHLDIDTFSIVGKDAENGYLKLSNGGWLSDTKYITSINGKITEVGDKVAATNAVYDKKIASEEIVAQKSPFVLKSINIEAPAVEKIGIKTEATDAVYRVVACKSISLTKNAIVKLLKEQGKTNEQLDRVAGLLDTEFGKSLIAMSLGAGMTQVAQEKHPKLARFARECRIQSITTLGNSIIDSVIDATVEAIRNAPSEDKNAEEDESYFSLENEMIRTERTMSL